MDLINFLRSTQRQEAIDEQKKISKRALNSEFAFIKRLGEDSLPPSPIEKYNLLKIQSIIQLLRRSLEGVQIELDRLASGGGSEYVDSGSSIMHWNNLINLVKNLNLNQKDVDEFWKIVDENIYPILDNINVMIDNLKISNPDLSNVYDIQALDRMLDYVENFQFGTIPIFDISNISNVNISKNYRLTKQLDKEAKRLENERLNIQEEISKIEEEIKAPEKADELEQNLQKKEELNNILQSVQNEEIQLENKIENFGKKKLTEEQKIERGKKRKETIEKNKLLEEEARKKRAQLVYDQNIMKKYYNIFEKNPTEAEKFKNENIDSFNRYLYGKGKPKKINKKMDDEQIELIYKMNNNYNDNKHNKLINKPLKTQLMSFDDSRDSNYL